MNQEQLSEIKARRQAISKGEWKTGPDFEGSVGVWLGDGHWVGWDIEGTCRECFANLEFIAQAPKDIDALIAEVERLRKELESCDDNLMMYTNH